MKHITNGKQWSRREFLGVVAAGAAAAAVASCATGTVGKALTRAGETTPAKPPTQRKLTPVGFVCHGGPPLALDNVAGKPLRDWGSALAAPAVPSAILCISAHWELSPASIGTTTTQPLYYDYWGFEDELYELQYPAPGAPTLAKEIQNLVAAKLGHDVEIFEDRALDHGVFVPLIHMFPKADVPVLQLSLPMDEMPQLFELGQALAPLREQGVLILGSGAITHNFNAVRSADGSIPGWASDFDGWVADTLNRKDWDALMDYVKRAPGVEVALPTHEHFTPLVLCAGAASDGDAVTYPQVGLSSRGSSRRSVQFG